MGAALHAVGLRKPLGTTLFIIVGITRCYGCLSRLSTPVKRQGSTSLARLSRVLLPTLLSVLTLMVPTTIPQLHAVPRLSNPQPSTTLQGTCFFGTSFAVNDGLLAVGSGCADVVHVYNSSSGNLLYTLSGDPTQLDSFGVSIAMGRGLLVVGAPYHNAGNLAAQTGAGLVYVFNASSGTLLATVGNPNPEFYGFFGFSLALDNGLLVVGSPDPGHVYEYNASSGTLLETLTAPDTPSGAAFGYSVAIKSGMIVVGAPGYGGCSGWAGRTYVFKASSGALLTTLSSPNEQDGVAGGFGESVSMSDGLLVVGAPCETVDGILQAGRAYVYRFSSLALLSTLVSPNINLGGQFEEDANFGWTVAIGEGLLVVGAPYENPDASGQAYVFRALSDALFATLTDPNTQQRGNFGYNAIINVGLLIISATGSNLVYIYKVANALQKIET